MMLAQLLMHYVMQESNLLLVVLETKTINKVSRINIPRRNIIIMHADNWTDNLPSTGIL